MKIFIKLMTLLLLISCAAPFFILGPNGRPLLTLDQLKFPKLSTPKMDVLTGRLSLPEGDEKVEPEFDDAIQVYKWRDDEGVVHYSDRRLPGQNNTLTEIKGITILPSRQKQMFGKREIVEPSAEQSHSSSFRFPNPTSVPLHEVPKLINDAKQVEKKLQERKKRQDEVVDSLDKF